MDRQQDRWRESRVDGQIGQKADGWTVSRMDSRWVDSEQNGQTADGWTVSRMDRQQMGRQTTEWTDSRWVDKQQNGQTADV